MMETKKTWIESFLTINFVEYAIPFFFLAILFEVFLTWRRGRNLYRVNDALTCLATGILSELTGLFSLVLTGFGYLMIYRHLRWSEMLTFPSATKLGLWILLIFAQDLAYYWFHRAAHRINLGWGGHIVHHSSEEYNLAVALRQSSLQQYFSWIFYLPLALIGFPPEWIASVISLNLVYQFWFHTREIDKMPRWFEAVFNTPSHHRVHHGINPQYLDKNYAGIFIIWDRFFGTFEPEGETPRYGITTGVGSWNPLWINFHYYWYLIQASRAAPSASEALKLWIAPPEWAPEWLVQFRGYRESKNIKKFDTPITRSLALYAIVSFVTLLVFSVIWLETNHSLPLIRSVTFVAIAILAFVGLGGLLERKPWAQDFERVRLPLLFWMAPLLLFPGLTLPQILLGFTPPGLLLTLWFQRVVGHRE